MLSIHPVFFFNLLVIYLAELGLSYSMRTLSWGMWDLVPWPGIEPEPSALGVWSLSHWTAREVSMQYFEELLVIVTVVGRKNSSVVDFFNVLKVILNIGMLCFYLSSLYCALQILHYLQVEGLWQPCIEKIYRHRFLTAFAHFVSLCHILVILTIVQKFF